MTFEQMALREKPLRAHIGNCPVDDFDLQGLIAYLIQSIQHNRKTLVSGVNAIMYVRSVEDPDYLPKLEAMDVVTIDGFWLAKAGPWVGVDWLQHLSIVRLTFMLLEKLQEEDAKVFLLGTKPDIVKAAAKNVEVRFPGIRVVGKHHGYFSEFDEEDIAHEIDESGACLVLVGISTPKRETWMIRNRDSLDAPVVIGVGGLLDILAGETKEGPDWLRSIGMMWFFRFLQEPRRMWKRYLLGNIRFTWLLVKLGISIRMNNRTPNDLLLQ